MRHAIPLGLAISLPPPNGVVIIGQTTLVSGVATGAGGGEPVLVETVTVQIGGGAPVTARLSFAGGRRGASKPRWSSQARPVQSS